MNKRQKIIVSIVGITIVLLALLGITYAYYLTRIEGNTNTNSISITTADLKLEYRDGDGFIEKSGVMPGEVIAKSFTVENKGSNAVKGYVVVLENVVNELSRKEDLIYTLECKLDDDTDCGILYDTVFPNTSDVSMIFSNDIEVGVKHNYTLTVTYQYLDDVNQSDDMGKKFSGKVNIIDIKGSNPYSSNTNTVAYNIIENARKDTSGTILGGTADSKVGYETNKVEYFLLEPSEYEYYITAVNTDLQPYYAYSDSYERDPDTGLFSLVNPQVIDYRTDYATLKGKYIGTYAGSDDEENALTSVSELYEVFYVINNSSYVTNQEFAFASIVGKTSNESVIAIEQDNYGTSYYYRGVVDNNFLNFNNLCWRIVRVEGDGAIKIVLEDRYATCNDTVDSDGSGTADYMYTGNWSIGRANYGYYETEDGKYLTDYENSNDRTNSIQAVIDSWLSNKFSSDNLAKLKDSKICIGDDNEIYDEEINLITRERGFELGVFFYEPYVRLSNGYASLKCSSNQLSTSTYKAYPLTVDEVVFAGGLLYYTNDTFYLINDYQKEQMDQFWTLTKSMFVDESMDDYVYSVNYDGFIFDNFIFDHPDYSSSLVRPAVSLIPGTVLSGGDGTQSNPYVVS